MKGVLCMPGWNGILFTGLDFARVYNFFWHEMGNSYSHT
jgi:hypothetical protein